MSDLGPQVRIKRTLIAALLAIGEYIAYVSDVHHWQGEHYMTRENAMAQALRTHITVRKLLRESGATPPDDELARKGTALAREILLRVDAINLLDRVRKDHQASRARRRSVL
jgi:hypothetical protein